MKWGIGDVAGDAPFFEDEVWAAKLALLKGRATGSAVVTLLDNIFHPTANSQRPLHREGAGHETMIACRSRSALASVRGSLEVWPF